MKEYFNLPEKVKDDHYEKVREEVKKLFSKDKSVLSIYEYGSVSSPGVSDIDLIFILRDEILDEGSIDLKDASDATKRLVADGTVIKMPKEVMEDIFYIDELFPRKLLGEDISFTQPTEEEKRYIKSVALIDWMPERLLKLGKMHNTDQVNVNHTLCTLHSFCYSLKSLNNILGETDESTNIIQLTAELRNNWYELDSPEIQLLRLIEEALDTGHIRLFDYFQYLKGEDLYFDNQLSLDLELDLELYPDCFIRFSDTQSPIGYRDSLKLAKDGKSFIKIPNYFLPHFYCQSIQGGRISNNISTKFTKEFQISLDAINHLYRGTIEKKVSIMEQNAQFLIKHNLSSGLIRFGFHF